MKTLRSVQVVKSELDYLEEWERLAKNLEHAGVGGSHQRYLREADITELKEKVAGDKRPFDFRGIEALIDED